MTAPRSPWIRRALLALLLLAVAGVLAVWLGLDPWLRRQLTRQVTQASHGQYQLQVAGLRTRLWGGELHLRGLALRPTHAAVADTLPLATARLARLDVYGVGLLALLRGRVAPVDSLTLDSMQVAVRRLPTRPAPHSAPPFWQQHPLRLGRVALRHVSGELGPAATPQLALAEATATARDLLLSTAGAADTQRLAFAASWQVALRELRGTAGGHRARVGAAAFSSASGRVVLDSVRVRPPAPGQGRPGAVRVHLDVARAQVTGLRAAAWQHTHRLQADSATLTAPRLTFRPPAQPPPPLWQLLRPLAARATLGYLGLSGGYLAVAGVQEQPVARDITGSARDLRVDSTAGQASSGRIVYARAWEARTGRLTARFNAPVYQASAEQLRLHTASGSLHLLGLRLVPTRSAAQLNLLTGYQLTQLTAHLPELRAENLDFQRLSARSALRIGQLTAERPWLRLSSDGRGPLNPHRSLLTPEALRRLRLPLDVRRLTVRGGTLLSLYRSPHTPLTGRLLITRLSGTFRNVSNEPGRMSARHPLTGTATAWLGGQCQLQAHLRANTLDPLGQHTVWGSFGPASLTLLNSMLEPTQQLGFRSGQVRGIAFQLRGDRQGVAGTMRARYSGLRFEFLKYKNGQLRQPLLPRLKQSLVNGVVIRNENPRPGGRLVLGDMRSRREPRFSVFALWRQGLVSGLLNSAGVPRPLARKLSQRQDSGPLPGR